MQKENELVMLDPAKAALILIHWQNDITATGGKARRDVLERLAAEHTIENTQVVLKMTREKGIPVIFVNGSHRPGYPEIPVKAPPLTKHLVEANALVRGTWGAEVIDQLKPLENEIVIHNCSTSGFCYTDLDIILRNKGISDLVLTGVATNWSVEGTARDGFNRGYSIYILKDCCNSTSEEMHNWTLKNIFPFIGVVLDSKAYIAALQVHAR